MPETMTTTYSLDELKGRAHENAMENCRTRLNAWFEPERVTEDLVEVLDYEFGINKDSVSWSLGYCQSDYVSFQARNIDLYKLKDEDVLKLRKHLDAAAWLAGETELLDVVVDFDGKYTPEVDVHEFSVDCCHHPLFEKAVEDLQDACIALWHRIIARLTECGYAAVEAQTCDEECEYYAEEHNWRFDEYGGLL